MPGHELLELASVCARIHMQSEPAPCLCTRGTGVLAPTGVGQNRAGLRAREGPLMVSALPQHPWSLNHHSSQPLARADQTSCWPARRSWQKRGQVLNVLLAPILVTALHSNPFVTLFQTLFRGRSHSELTLSLAPGASGPAFGPELGRNFGWAAQLESA